MQDEARLFAAYLEGISDSDRARVEPLPLHHRLSEAESAHLWAELDRRWNVKRAPMWFPFDRRDEPPPHAEVFDTNLCDVELPRQLREALASLGVSRLWQLAKHEDQRDFELDLALLDFFPFDLDVVVDELYWTDASFAWLIYASHEDTFTIAGAELLRALQAAWPAWRDFVAK